MDDVISKIESVKDSVMSDPSVKTAWETLHSRINNQRFNVDERTMTSINMVNELTRMNLNAQNAPITAGTGLHYQKRSELCTQFATISAVRHEMKKIIGNLKSKGVNMDKIDPYSSLLILIPAGKSIDELFKENEFEFSTTVFNSDGRNVMEKFPNALSFERMLSVFLGCVSPKSLSGLVKTLKI